MFIIYILYLLFDAINTAYSVLVRIGINEMVEGWILSIQQYKKKSTFRLFILYFDYSLPVDWILDLFFAET